MRFRVRRLLGVSALALLFGLPMTGCSGQQQQEEGLEVEQGNQQAAEGEEGGEENATNQQAEGEEGSNEEATNQEATNQEAGDDTAEAGDGTENDLQEIIQEMNGQPQDAAAAAPADLASQPAAPAAMPVDNTAAAVPAAAPAPASTGSVLPFQPGGTPAGSGLPELGSKMAYVVEKGDTLGKISSKIYGSPARWNELATLSGITTPSRIFPGDLIYYTLDEGAVPFAAAYESIQKSEEAVQPGDTLATIAKRVYGTGNAWRAIWRQNDKIENPDVVTGSSVVYIPHGAASTAMHKAKVGHVSLAKSQKSHNSDKQVSFNTNMKTSLSKLTANNSILLAKSQNVKPMVKISNVTVVPTFI